MANPHPASTDRRSEQKYAFLFKHQIFLLVVRLAIVALVITGCTQAGATNPPLQNATETTATPVSTPSPFITANKPETVPNPTSTPSPVATEPSNDGLWIDYQINADLDYAGKNVRVEQQITIAGLPVGFGEIALVVEPNRYSGGFNLQNLAVESITLNSYSLDGNQLRFEIPQSVRGTSPYRIYLSYQLILPEIPPPSEMYKPQPYGYTAKQLNLVDWYPFVPPLDDQNQWVIHQPSYFGESLVYPASDYSVNLTVTGNSFPLIVAASSPAERAENHYSFHMQQARNFAISISPSYELLESKSMSGINVRAYAFTGNEAQNQAVLQYAIEAINLFSELFGPLPHQSVSIVQADFLDGMEYDGLYFVSKGFYNLYDGTIQGYLSIITVHEMAHQWFYGVVGNDQALEPWLDEGLATFSELVYFEHYYPELVTWWWDYRVNVYQPQGVINLPVYEYGSYIAYRDAVYLRGAKFFDELRRQVGEDQFVLGLQQYCAQNFRKIAGQSDFFEVFKGHSLEQLLSGYFNS